MNRALFKLLLLNNKAAWRRTLRGVKTIRGAFLLLFTLGFFAIMIGPQVWMSGRPEMRPAAGTSSPFAAPALFALTLLIVFSSAGEAAVYFTPAEVDFLFAAPFNRRELLYYKLARTLLALLVMSAFFSLTFLTSIHYWPWGYVGLLLAMAMVQLLGMVTALTGQIVAESAYTRGRKFILLVVTVVVLAGLADVTRRVEGQTPREIAIHLRESAIFRVLLAPFEVFTRTMFAERWFPDFVGWGAAALAIDAALLVLVLKLDANYIEAAATISQKVYERIRRTKQGGGIAMPVGPRAGRLRLPPLPWLAGAGPIAWRQLLLAMRTSRQMLITTMALVVMFGAGFAFSPRGAPGPGAPPVLPGLSIAMIFYLTFIFSMQLPWAFRGDLDHIDFLKTLPVRPAIVAAGELAGGVLLLTAIQLAILGLLTALDPSGWPIMLAGAAFCVPINVLLMSLNNGLFLMYPVRMPVGTTFDFQMMGKTMLFMFLQLLLLIPLLGIPAALGALAYVLSGFSWPAFAVAAWLVLLVELLPLLFGVAWAFQRFDISTETPA
jgi:Putative ABC exporter